MIALRARPCYRVVCVAAIACAPAAWAQDRVSETVHNLSASGPGEIRAPGEQQVCIFCHAPHNTQGVRPLWNRELPVTSYRIYESSTLDAKPRQPTGSSKLCLSCHDGTIALGSVLSRADRIRMVGGDFIPAGLTNLGTDLSDDHPISFFYTSGLAASDRQLADPQSLPREVRLEAGGELQCTSCHDAHYNVHGNFLVMPDQFGALCIACHKMNGWSACSHRDSGAPLGRSRAGDWPYATVAENACRSCHRSHAAGGHERLMIHEMEEDNCLDCHDGQVAQTDIRSEIEKRSAHDPRRYVHVHDPTETAASSKPHVECSDCHNPHAVAPGPVETTYVPIGSTMARVAGITVGGAYVETARWEYEVCFRCHGDAAVSDISERGMVARQAQSANMRLKFSATSPSYHPVVVPSPNTDTISLVPSLPQGSLIRCTDCHNNDAGPRAGGAGPDGPHGSIYDKLLERNYDVLDDSVESEYAYALCYKCHQRSSILADQSFPEHSRHVEQTNAPCSACHDPHGINLTQSFGSDHTHLINFDTQIARPEPTTGRLEFRDLGKYAGSCTLTCHGRDHVDEQYVN